MKTYSIIDSVCTISGPGGSFNMAYAEGVSDEGITFAYKNPFNTMTIGGDGQGMHSLSPDKSGMVKGKFLKTAPINAKLMTMVNFQRSSSANHGQNTIRGGNTALNDVSLAQQCAFTKIPDMVNAKEGGFYEWEWDVIQLDMSLGTTS